MPRPTSALIVDDEPHVRTFLRLLLKELGIVQCWDAGSGQQALDMVKAHRPQLVLLDLNLPELNGLEVLARLKVNDPALPVVVVTSQNTMKTVLEAVRLGAAAYVLKHRPKPEALRSLEDVLDSLENTEPESDDDDVPPSAAG